MSNAAPAENKRRIESFYRALNARDVDAVMAHYAPGAKIAVFAAGPFAGQHVASHELLQGLFAAFSEIQFTLLGMTAEGDRVAAELRSRGRTADGSPYANRYHNCFELRDGQIAHFREYPTGYAKE